MTHDEIAARREAALKSFWSDDPLNLTYRQETGRSEFTLRSFIAFVLELPQEQFESCTRRLA